MPLTSANWRREQAAQAERKVGEGAGNLVVHDVVEGSEGGGLSMLDGAAAVVLHLFAVPMKLQGRGGRRLLPQRRRFPDDLMPARPSPPSTAPMVRPPLPLPLSAFLCGRTAHPRLPSANGLLRPT